MLIDIFKIINFFILCYLILFSIGYVILLLASIRDVKLRYQEVAVGDALDIMKSPLMPPVTVIIAAYNEEEYILDSVYSVLKSDYPHLNLLIVNDGSTDKTMQKLISEFNLYKTDTFIPEITKTESKLEGYYLSSTHSNIVLIDKTHKDRGDSLNVALNACRSPLFFTLDADTLIEPNAISELVFYAMTRPHAVAVGGAVYVLNGCKFEKGVITEARVPYRFIPGFQCLEYLRSFVFNRAGWNIFKGAMSYSGTATLFEHQAVVEAGGFERDNFANDFEIITRLHAYKSRSSQPYEMGFTPAATVWTDVPTTLRGYWNQRFSWQFGTLQSLFEYEYMLFNPKYGVVGFFVYPFYLFGEALGGIVEFLAYLSILVALYLGIYENYTVVMLYLVCLGYILALTMATLLMDLITFDRYTRLRDLPWLFILIVFETIGFRQFSVLCRTMATLKYIFTIPSRRRKRAQLVDNVRG